MDAYELALLALVHNAGGKVRLEATVAAGLIRRGAELEANLGDDDVLTLEVVFPDGD